MKILAFAFAAVLIAGLGFCGGAFLAEFFCLPLPLWVWGIIGGFFNILTIEITTYIVMDDEE